MRVWSQRLYCQHFKPYYQGWSKPARQALNPDPGKKKPPRVGLAGEKGFITVFLQILGLWYAYLYYMVILLLNIVSHFQFFIKRSWKSVKIEFIKAFNEKYA